jgi:hypothetical protein
MDAEQTKRIGENSIGRRAETTGTRGLTYNASDEVTCRAYTIAGGIMRALDGVMKASEESVV